MFSREKTLISREGNVLTPAKHQEKACAVRF